MVLTGFYSGVSVLSGSCLSATDLRGGMSLVLAALASKGTTEINGVSHIDRGYENVDTKLRLLGANVKRLTAITSSELNRYIIFFPL